MAEEGKFRVEQFRQKLSVMEDANGGLSVPERSVLVVGRKSKTAGGYEDEEWEVFDKKALGTIWLCLASSVAFNISK